MNTKQLINELKSPCILTKLEKKEIIELLEENVELKKYEKMWEEFDDLYGHFGIIPIGTYYRIEILMERLKQKYFPKKINIKLPKLKCPANFTDKVMKKIMKGGEKDDIR